MSKSDTGGDLQKQIEQLRKLYLGSLHDKQVRIEQLWVYVQDDFTNIEAAQELQRLVHQLAGSAGSYGLVGLGELAQKADVLITQALLKSEPELNKLWLHLDELINQLLAELKIRGQSKVSE